MQVGWVRFTEAEELYKGPHLLGILRLGEVPGSKQSSLYTPDSCEHQDRFDASFLTVFGKGSSGERMQREVNQVQGVRNTQEANRRRRPRQEGRRSSGPCDSPWIEHEIWIFLQEWEVVEYQIGNPGKKMKKKVTSLCGRLYKRGLRKSRKSCLDLMLEMLDLHKTLCNESPEAEPLISPYAWDLFKILGHRSQRSHVPGPLSGGSGSPPAPDMTSLSICDAISPDPCFNRWTDLEVRIFLQEWEAVEHEIGHPGDIYTRTSLVCQRLYQMGVKKHWQSCVDLMWTLMNLHSTLLSERPRIVPLFSPYAEALYRILGHKWQGVHAPGALYDWSGNPIPSMYPQPPMMVQPSVYQPWDSGMSVSSGLLHGNPSLMMSSQDSLVPRWEAWNPSYPSRIPHVLPASVPGDTNLQLQWLTSDDNSSPP